MKNIFNKVLLVLLLFGVLSCQNEDDALIEENLFVENEVTKANLETKASGDVMVVCSIEEIPDGYQVEEYFISGSCPNFNLFLGIYNAAIVSRINTIPNATPIISSAGAGCNDNYCIWIVGSKFEDNAYVDVRTTTASGIIGTYRGDDINHYVNAQGQDVITFRLRSAYEKSEFASRGLRIWVVNPIARKWADGRTVKRPRTPPIGPIDPPCAPRCP